MIRLIEDHSLWTRRRRILCAAVCVGILSFTSLAIGMLAAKGPAAEFHFEVVSVKPSGDGIISTKPQFSPGKFVWTTDMAYLISYAYDLDIARVDGAGHRLGNAYTINATTAPNTKEPELRLMVCSLLAERFNLRTHSDVQQADGFALVVAKGGIRMKESTLASRPGADTTGTSSAATKDQFLAVTTSREHPGALQVRAKDASIAELAQALGRATRTPYWDKTGLTKKYDFEFLFVRDADAPGDVPVLSTALRESTGLTTERQKGSVETLVIDNLEVPSEN